MVELDVSGIIFDYVDFTEAWLFITQLPEPNRKLQIRAWGVTLLPDLKGYYGEKYSDDIYISGYCDIIFDKIIGAELYMGLYTDETGQTFYHDENGKEILIHNHWGNVNKKESVALYVLGGVLEWPNAYCSELNIFTKSKDKVTLKYRDEDVILAKEYCKSPKKYTYKRK